MIRTAMILVRPARPDDYTAFVRLFGELAIPDPVPPVDEWERRAPTTLVAECEEGVAGYLFYELLEELFYVRHVVSDPARRRMGVGRALMSAARARAHHEGAKRWCLNVKDDNVAAIRLYESFGMAVESPSRVLRLPWTLPSRIPGARPAVSMLQAGDQAEVERALALMPEEVTEVERALALLPGQLERLHSEGRVPLVARGEDGAVVGLAAFDPKFPGAYPFRADNEATAAALVEAMAPYRVPDAGEDWRAHSVQVVLENQEAVADALVALGAAPVFRILHLAGTLEVQHA